MYLADVKVGFNKKCLRFSNNSAFDCPVISNLNSFEAYCNISKEFNFEFTIKAV